nr:hypothetical protein [Burkholderia catarinensis]
MDLDWHDHGTSILEIPRAMPAVCKAGYGHLLDFRLQYPPEPATLDGPERKSNDRHITRASLRVQKIANAFELPLLPLDWTWNYELVAFKASHEPIDVDRNDSVAIYVVMATLEIDMSIRCMVEAKSHLPDLSCHLSIYLV